MAFVIGSICSPLNTKGSAPFTGFVQPQPPTYGVVATAPTGSPETVSVLWQSGRLEADVPVATIDEIKDADSTEQDRLRGKIIQPSPDSFPSSPEYSGVPVAFYKRDPASAGTAAENLALVRTSSGLFYEAQTAGLVPVPGR